MFESKAIELPKIVVVGVGGGGGNAVNRMIESGVEGVDYVTINTDKQAVYRSMAPIKPVIGEKLTHGYGAGGNPEVGKKAAEESEDEIAEIVKDADMVFITAGMGGGTGTGAAPVVAEIARDNGALVVAIVTKPFTFEGKKRQQYATAGIANLKNVVDALIVVPNDKLASLVDKQTSLGNAFEMADDILRQACKGISEIINGYGVINVVLQMRGQCSAKRALRIWALALRKATALPLKQLRERWKARCWRQKSQVLQSFWSILPAMKSLPSATAWKLRNTSFLWRGKTPICILDML